MKQCYKCKNEYPVDEMYTHTHSTRKSDTTKYLCKPCNRDKSNRYRIRQRISLLQQISQYTTDGIAQCRYCKNTEDKIEFNVDHIIPHSKGGLSSIENYQYICKNCNRAKGDLSHDEFVAYIQMLTT